jgi:hypothetical protein
MSSSQVRPRLPTFFELYSQGHATPDQIDDFVDQWHGGDGQQQAIHEYLGLSLEQYDFWMRAPDALPKVLAARREGRPLEEVLRDYLKGLARTDKGADAETAKAVGAWLAQRLG